MTIPLLFELGKWAGLSVLGSLGSEALGFDWNRIRAQAQQAQSTPIDKIGFEGETIMYDIIGNDSYGSVGADESLLRALSVSGMGDSEIIGADFIAGSRATGLARYLVGAAEAAAATGDVQTAQTLKALAMRNGGAVVNQGVNKKRRYPIGFVPTTIAATTAALIPAAPQNLFRPERLVIPSDIAFDFGVRDVKIGNTSQLVQSVEIPGALFTEVSIDTNVTFDTAEVGNQISVDVRNKTAGGIDFSAGAIGTVAK